MPCKLMKKGLVAAALGAGALALLFGTAAPSYVKTAFHRVRANAKHNVPIPFEIDRIRRQIADLEPAIHVNRENIASAEVDVEQLQKKIGAAQANLTQETKEILALRKSLDTGDFRLAGNVTYTADEVKNELNHRFQRYQQSKSILKEMEATLKARQKAVVSARKQLDEMVNAKQSLLTRVEEIEARVKAIEATQAANQYTFDDSELARVKESVSELEKRVEVMARVAEQEGRLSDKGLTVIVEPSHDVVKEIDAEFGSPNGSTTASADKSL